LPHDGIEERVEHQRDEDRTADKRTGQADHLIVEQQKDGLKAIVLDAECDGAEAVKQFGLRAVEIARDLRVEGRNSRLDLALRCVGVRRNGAEARRVQDAVNHALKVWYGVGVGVNGQARAS